MAYLKISDNHIYLPQERLAVLQREAAGDALTFARSMIDEKTRDKVHAQVVRNIENEFKKDPNLFHQNWISLRLYGDSAKKNIFWLISDFIQCTGHGRLVDIRDPDERLIDSHSGGDFDLPYGPLFVFRSDSHAGILRKPRRGIELYIDVNTVYKILGDFPSFRIYTTGFDIDFDQDIKVFPSCLSQEIAEDQNGDENE